MRVTLYHAERRIVTDKMRWTFFRSGGSIGIGRMSNFSIPVEKTPSARPDGDQLDQLPAVYCGNRSSRLPAAGFASCGPTRCAQLVTACLASRQPLLACIRPKADATPTGYGRASSKVTTPQRAQCVSNRQSQNNPESVTGLQWRRPARQQGYFSKPGRVEQDVAR